MAESAPGPDRVKLNHMFRCTKKTSSDGNTWFNKVKLSFTCLKQGINILRIAKRVPVEHPQFASENN